MKLKPFIRVRPGKISAGTVLVDDKLRADLFLPAWMFGLGVFLIMFFSIVGTVTALLRLPVFFPLLSAVLVLGGVAMLLCWKNQTIHMVDDDRFAYRTFLGKTTVYRFDEITRIKRRPDSATLFVAEGKVYLDHAAIVSGRLAARLNEQLERLGFGKLEFASLAENRS